MATKASQIAHILAAKDSSFFKTVRESRQNSREIHMGEVYKRAIDGKYHLDSAIMEYAECLAKKFIDKVESGKARSVETYSDCKKLLELIELYLSD